MAKTSTLTIKYAGAAIAGAEVFFGDVIGTVKITDANGQITATTADTYASVEWLAVRHSSFPTGAVALGICLFEAGKNYEYNIPLITGVAEMGTNIVSEV